MRCSPPAATNQEVRYELGQPQRRLDEHQGQGPPEWAKLTDDDVELIQGKGEELLGRLQHHYGMKKDEAERQVDDWLRSIRK